MWHMRYLCYAMCFTVHIIFVHFDKHSSDLGLDTCLAPEGFKRWISGPRPEKVVHHCTKVSKRSWTLSAYCNVQAALAAKMWPTLAARPTGIFPGVPAAQSTTVYNTLVLLHME